MSLNIEASVFRRRVQLLQRNFKENKQFQAVTCLVSALGKGDDDVKDKTTSILHVWLLGTKFSNTVIIVTVDKVYFFTSAKQAKVLDELRSDHVEIVIRSKDVEETKTQFKELITPLMDGVIGEFTNDKFASPIISEWLAIFAEIVKDKDLTVVDVASAFKALLNYKDEEELKAIRTASKASVGILTGYLFDEVAAVIDEDLKVTHSKISNQVSNIIDDEKYFRKLRLGAEFDPWLLDWISKPLIQSGGEYDLSLSAEPNDKNLQAGIVLCSMNLGYKFYCSSVTRTYLFGATEKQQHEYSVLFNLQKRVLAAIKHDAKCSDVYQAAIDYLNEKDKGLLAHLDSNVGWGIGIELQEQDLGLKAGNETQLKDGMTLAVRVSFKDLKDAKAADKSYVLCLEDTIRVTLETPIIFTDAPKNRDEVFFDVANEDDKKTKQKKDNERQTRTRASDHKREVDDNRELRLQAHQKTLRKRLQEQNLQRYAKLADTDKEEEKVEFRKFESYKRETQLPKLNDLRVTVDTRAQSIIIPINGRPVPFHINTFKNGSKNDEGDYVYIRLNFNTPDTGSGKVDTPFENPQATFIKSITLRSRDADRMVDTFKKISDLKRDSVRREAERKELADVVHQDKLLEVKDRRPLRLEPVFVRPIPEGKRVAGTLEIHRNGVRYHSPAGKEQQVDVLFSNVANLFFQSCDHELIVLIHLHLINPIMVGKRKTKDIQFYRDATDMSFDETGNRKRRYRYGDEDELEQEQEERRLRQTLNKEFRNFAEQISNASNGKLEVDIPFRELGFNGVPFRSNVLCQPTTDCLVQLVDTPFLVVKLADVECAHLERIQFGLREFDLVFVFKDYSVPVIHIDTIPVSQLDGVKEWLNEVDIPYYSHPMNLKWSQIMKPIKSDPYDFFKLGGWDMISVGDDDDDSEGQDDQGESEFEVSEEELEESDDYSEEESEEDFEENSFDEEEESGENWDDLEEEAAKEDQEHETKKNRHRR